MILYAESSAILAWLLGEPSQKQILALLKSATAVFCSRLTVVECARGLIAAEEGGRISVTSGNRARNLIAHAVKQWSILEITPEVCQRASQRFPQEPLRSLDALHLASLLELHAAEPRIQPISLDQRVRDNALLLGFDPKP